MLRYAYDTEFLEDGKTIEFISIGIVCEDGREYYAVNSEMDIDRILKRDWLMENVVPHLPGSEPKKVTDWGGTPNTDYWVWSLDLKSPLVKPKWVIANEVREFLLPAPEGALIPRSMPELWAYYGAYDHVVLAQLWGPMIALPDGIPMFTHDIMQLHLPKLPPKPDNAHDALADARWNMDVLRKAKVIVPTQWGGNLVATRQSDG